MYVIRGRAGIARALGGGLRVTSERVVALVEVEEPHECIYCGETIFAGETAYFLSEPRHGRCKDRCERARDLPHDPERPRTVFAHPARVCDVLRPATATE